MKDASPARTAAEIISDEYEAHALMQEVLIKDNAIDTGDLSAEEIERLGVLVPGFKSMLVVQPKPEPVEGTNWDSLWLM